MNVPGSRGESEGKFVCMLKLSFLLTMMVMHKSDGIIRTITALNKLRVHNNYEIKTKRKRRENRKRLTF